MRTGVNLAARRKASAFAPGFFAMVADAHTTSADTLGRPNCASSCICHPWAEGNKFTSGLAAALACTLRYWGPGAFTTPMKSWRDCRGRFSR
jgi:hypothetical protein